MRGKAGIAQARARGLLGGLGVAAQGALPEGAGAISPVATRAQAVGGIDCDHPFMSGAISAKPPRRGLKARAVIKARLNSPARSGYGRSRRSGAAGRSASCDTGQPFGAPWPAGASIGKATSESRAWQGLEPCRAGGFHFCVARLSVATSADPKPSCPNVCCPPNRRRFSAAPRCPDLPPLHSTSPRAGILFARQHHHPPRQAASVHAWRDHVGRSRCASAAPAAGTAPQLLHLAVLLLTERHHHVGSRIPAAHRDAHATFAAAAVPGVKPRRRSAGGRRRQSVDRMAFEADAPAPMRAPAGDVPSARTWPRCKRSATKVSERLSDRPRRRALLNTVRSTSRAIARVLVQRHAHPGERAFAEEAAV